MLGSGWNHSCEWSLDIQADKALLHAGDGKTYAFMEDTGGGYLPSAYNHWTLNDEGSELIAQRPGGIGYYFATDGSLTKIEDAWGNRVGCSYGTNDCLEAATHSNGRQLVFSNVWNSAVSEWRIDSISVLNGPFLQFFYNSDGQVTQVVEAVGLNSYSSIYQYVDGFLTNRIDRAGHTYTYEYETGDDGLLNGKKTFGIVGDWYEQSIAYPTFQITEMTRITRGTNQIERYSRNTDNILTEKYGPAGTVAELTSVGTRYSRAENKIDITEETQFDNNTGSTWSQWMLYDDVHNITNLSVGYNTTTPVPQMVASYDPDWQLITSLTDAEGYRTETVYTNGSPLVQKDFWSSTNSYDTYFAYTSNGLPCAITNANESVMEFEYDEMGNLIAVVPEIGPSWTNTYNVLGYIESTEVLAENGESTGRFFQFGTDPHGRITGIVFPDGLTNTYAYNALGMVTNELDRAGRATNYTYAPGEEKRLTSVTQYLEQGGSNIPVRIAYDMDEQANVLRISEPRGRYVESYQLDIQDRITTVTNIEGQVMSIDYSVGDFVTEITRFDGSKITNTYDNAGRKSTVSYIPAGETAASVIISYDYYADGMLSKISDGTGYVTNRYDGLNRLTYAKSVTADCRGTGSYAYDSFGNVTNSYISYADLDGWPWGGWGWSSSYDSIGRLEERNGTHYDYNLTNGLVASVSNAVMSCSYTYDVMDHMESMTYRKPSGDLIQVINYQYDALGMITNKVIDSGTLETQIGYQYDSINRLVSESHLSSNFPPLTTAYAYDLAGNRISKMINDLDVSYSTVGAGNRLEEWNVSVPDGQMYRRVSGISSEPVGTDPQWGQLWISNTVTQVSTFPGIDGNSFYTDQIGFASGTQNIIAAIRDQAGNMGYVTNAVNCSFVTNALVAYNAAGCTTNITHQGPGGYTNSLALDWNEKYQLTSVIQGSAFNIQYSYDALGRRASRTEDGSSECYVYDGDHVSIDLYDNCVPKRSYTYGLGIDNILSMDTYTSGGNYICTYYYIKDQQNTVLALVDSSGDIVESYEYDAWGRILSVKDASGNELTSDLGLPTSAIGNRYTFQGREIDWSTGLHYFRARWYNPVSGRWLSKDPIGISGGLNQYAFCGNNPVNFVDPLGLDFFMDSKIAEFARGLGGKIVSAFLNYNGAPGPSTGSVSGTNSSGVLDVMKEKGKRIGGKFVTVGGIIIAVVTAPSSADAAERSFQDIYGDIVCVDWIVDEDGNLVDDGNIQTPNTDPSPSTGP